MKETNAHCQSNHIPEHQSQEQARHGQAPSAPPLTPHPLAAKATTTVATLRSKATLENALAAACDRNAVQASILVDIQAVAARALTAEQLRRAIDDQLAKLAPALASIDTQYHRRACVITNQRYPDESATECGQACASQKDGQKDGQQGAQRPHTWTAKAA